MADDDGFVGPGYIPHPTVQEYKINPNLFVYCTNKRCPMVLSGGARINRAGTKAPPTCKHCKLPFPKLPNGEVHGYKHYALLIGGKGKGKGKGKDKQYLGNASPYENPKSGNKGRQNLDSRFATAAQMEQFGTTLRTELLGAIKDLGRQVDTNGPTPAETRRKGQGAGKAATFAETVKGNGGDGATAAAPAPQGAAFGSAEHKPDDKSSLGGGTPGFVQSSSLGSKDEGFRNSCAISGTRGERVNALATALKCDPIVHEQMLMGMVVESEEKLAAAAAAAVVTPKIQKPTAEFQPFQEAYTQALKLVNISEAELKDTISEIADAVTELDRLEELANIQTAKVAEHKADMLKKHTAMHETSRRLSKVPAVAVCVAAPAPACSLLTESCMVDMEKMRSLLNLVGLASQDNPDLQEASSMFKKIMDACTVIKPEPNLSPPKAESGGTTGVSAAAVVDPSVMADTAIGGKLYREPDQSASADERDHARKKAKSKSGAAKEKWAETTDDDAILEETDNFGGDAAASLDIVPTSPAPSDDGADKIAKAPTSVPG